jgi:hypothetical protein
MTVRYFLVCTLPAFLFIMAAAGIFGLEALVLACRLGRLGLPKCFTRRRLILLHILTAIGLLCILWGFFIEPYRLQTTFITISTPKLEGTSFRIVQISDLHCGKKARLEPRLPDAINRLHPDIVVFTGDALNDIAALGLLQQTLSSISAPLGKFAVRGNVDNRLFPNIPLFENTGFTELSLDAVVLEKDGRSIGLCGIDHAEGRRSRQALKHLQPERFNILLFHTTDLVDYLEDCPVDLYLCGHTHGGQIALPVWGALVTQSLHGKQYEAGLFRKGSLSIYVNRGIGMTGGWAPPIRFLAPPEITVIDLVPQNAQTESKSSEPVKQESSHELL